MKRSSLLGMAALLALAGGAQAAVCRVSPTGSAAADGSTWALATTLRDAIDNGHGKDCTEIWVQRGTYVQGSEYTIARSLVLRGDFIGTEATAAARATPLDASRTVLDGGGTTRILYINGTTASGPITASTLVEAFTLTGGNGVGADVNMNGLGGAVYCDGYGTGHQCSPRFSGVVFTSNSTARGGAVYNDGYSSGLSSPTFTDVSFSQNTATLGGAVYNDATDAGTSSPTFSNATFSSNSASFSGGAVYGMATLIGTSDPVFTNVTFSGNSAPGNGSGGTGRGGAVAFEIQHTTIGNPVFTHVTFQGNTAGSMGGAIYNNALANAASNAVLQNSILWGNTAPNGTQVFNNSATATTALGSSILQGGCAGAGMACDAFTTASSAADPLLGPLQDNGGPTLTHLPGAGSPALDSADARFCPATDQRAVARPQGVGCDIGAVEVLALYTITPSAGPNGAISPDVPQSTPANATQAFTLTPVPGYVIDQVSGCSGTLVGNTYTTAPATADCTVQASFRAAAAPPGSSPTPVPTLGEWALMLMGALAAGLGVRRLGRKNY